MPNAGVHEVRMRSLRIGRAGEALGGPGPSVADGAAMAGRRREHRKSGASLLPLAALNLVAGRKLR